MGAGGFNGRVRNGIGWNSSANTTRSAKNRSQTSEVSNQIVAAISDFRLLFSDFWRAIRHLKTTFGALLRAIWPYFQT
jgi:hypothetical protein